MADPRLVVARRELASVRAEKTIVLALLIQLFIAAFSSFLVVGLVSLYDPGATEGYQVEVAVTGDARAGLLEVVREQGGIEGSSVASPEVARRAFERGSVDAVLLAERRGGHVAVTVTVPDGDIRTTLTVVRVRAALRAFERAERTARAEWLEVRSLDLPPPARSSPYYGFTYTVLVPLLLFLPIFISGSIGVDSMTEEFERGTVELLRVAPITMTDVLDGKLLAAAGLVPLQAALWIGLLRLNGTPVANPVALLALVAGLGVGVVALGVGIGVYAPDRRAAQFLYSLGVITVFGATALFPTNPANVVARLAIDSADETTTLLVVVYVAAGLATYALLRRRVVHATVDG